MHATLEKFGYPASEVKAYEHWVVLVRPAQPTLGSLVLAARSTATAFGDLPAGAHAELAEITRDIEAALATFSGYEKLNYLMLMMVDPQVHFHVIPRYEGAREWQGIVFADAGWPGPPALGDAHKLTGDEPDAMRAALQALWA
ncbi:HIT family protein [Novosphingobium mangrovi (ex Hu et al. 2023)]|uniref:HIT family protein n=1 Tax=Novosphingobium mangrovi (ex Hu et al. 2023) TaxID=2930094 RepID=A0ABT0AGE4_9SPHN|nr:HIT family protein [Novosphingobium mangrovi (ex Hu et al. 2023)]MCJ1962264.1 HIT family protein [Novosphingobium mangrovi (ex Hu et al. 2023)]